MRSLLLVCLAVCLYCAAAQMTSAEYTAAFENWAGAYGKQYASQAAEDAAFQNFKTNLDASVAQHAANVEGGANINADIANGVAANDGTTLEFGVHEYFDENAAQFMALRANLIVPPVAVPAGGLSNGAIAGIAIAAAVVAIAAVTAALVIKRRRSQPKHVEMKSPDSDFNRKKPARGIDVYSPKTDVHQSITARAQPVL